MKRLTTLIEGVPAENHEHDATLDDFKKGNRFRNGHNHCIKKLAAYEDTGLEPEEIVDLQKHYFELCDGLYTEKGKTMLSEWMAYKRSGFTPERVAELAEAAQEDRLIALPFKVGDEVYSVEKKPCGDCEYLWIDGACNSNSSEKYNFCPHCGAKMEGAQ